MSWNRRHFPSPVLSVAIEPMTRADQDKLSSAMAKLAEEDPTFEVRYTMRPARPSFPGWESFTWKCLWRGSAGSSTWKPA